MRRTLQTVLILVASLSASSTFAATAHTIVVPDGLRLMDGNSDSLGPFNIGTASMVYQQVYAASQFEEPLGVTITEIAFRPDILCGRGFNTTLPDIEIKLSTTSRGPDGLSPVLSDNVGADETVVVGRGPLHLTSGGGGVVTFDIRIPLSHAFFYNPQAGNLLLEVRNLGGGNTTFFDAVNVQGDSVSSVYAFSSLGGRPVADTIGLVTQFLVTPVPEPSALWLLGMGLASLGWVALRRETGRSTRREHHLQS